ncbi:MAG: PAS domain-containing sensor histidine kinase, partial [Rhodocyclaceae bacterium]|nr:PAS domain-containing sensor histidine kinase [Rhodocyclaceae bacterium]
IAHRRQKEVLASREFSYQLMETANAMMVGVDAAGRVIVLNKAAEHICGYRRDELLGRDWFETVMPRQRYPEAWAGFCRMHEAGGDVARSFEAPILTKSGEERIIAWQNSSIKEHGALAATLSFGIDVTERGQLERTRQKEEISRRLVAIQEDERRRLAVELHDRTSPNLSVININFKLLADSLPGPAADRFAALLEDTSATLEDTIASVRAISTDFRPPLLDYAGFWPAVEGYARQFSRRTGIAVQTEGNALAARLEADVETNLFRIVHEALANCARHSLAQTVAIRQARNGDVVTLAIADDGVGFDADAGGPGHGLMTMRRRAEFIGGTFRLDTRPGHGTRIVVEFVAQAPAETIHQVIVACQAANQAIAPSAAARPLAKQAVSR